MSHATKLKGNLLETQGTAGGNVHWKDSVVMVNELIKEESGSRQYSIPADHMESMVEGFVFVVLQ